MNWDVIVVGLGGVGSAAVYHLARAGQHVLGIDRYPPVHAYGSSHGKTRSIRQAYFEQLAIHGQTQLNTDLFAIRSR